jgi:hypothetical protein
LQRQFSIQKQSKFAVSQPIEGVFEFFFLKGFILVGGEIQKNAEHLAAYGVSLLRVACEPYLWRNGGILDALLEMLMAPPSTEFDRSASSGKRVQGCSDY